jgi:transcriptional regulator with XRE-family HTH domain
VAKKSPLFAGNSQLVSIGRRIRELRKEKGLSQEALAEAASIDRSYLGGIERGEHNFNVINLIKIASSLDADVGEFFR